MAARAPAAARSARPRAAAPARWRGARAPPSSTSHHPCCRVLDAGAIARPWFLRAPRTPATLAPMHDIVENERDRSALRADRMDRPARGLPVWARRVVASAVEAMLCDEDGRGELVPANPELC